MSKLSDYLSVIGIDIEDMIHSSIPVSVRINSMCQKATIQDKRYYLNEYKEFGNLETASDAFVCEMYKQKVTRLFK